MWTWGEGGFEEEEWLVVVVGTDTTEWGMHRRDLGEAYPSVTSGSLNPR